MRFGERGVAHSLPAEQTNRGRGAPLVKHSGCWCLPNACRERTFPWTAGRAVPCVASHLVRLAGDFFVARQQLLIFDAVSSDGRVRGWKGSQGKGCREGWRP